MPELPQAAKRYKVLGPFTEGTIPAGFLGQHSLKSHVWGRIVILEGRLSYLIERDPEVKFTLVPEAPGIVLPEERHRVEVDGPVRFLVEFWSA